MRSQKKKSVLKRNGKVKFETVYHNREYSKYMWQCKTRSEVSIGDRKGKNREA